MILLVGAPLLTVVLLSFWVSDGIAVYPAFTLANYAHVLSSPVTLSVFLATLRYAAITLVATGLIGFTCSYFLVFHVRTLQMQIALFLLCTIPFWTSNVIRMVSWVPFLGREGLANTLLLKAGIIQRPLDILLYSDFAVVLTYIHLFTLFMIVPIFNSMSKINPNLIEAARDAGASSWTILVSVIIPLSKTGI
ncbi:MAG: ABC transporter permease, partial [Alphaproteobacteria bacterium HGW-Alphaproteobacteria-8]